MIFRDPRCVFVTDDAGQAAVAVIWLEHHGIPAKVMDTMTMGGLEGLTAWVGVSSRGIEVWVLKEDEIERARELIEERKGFQSEREAQNQDARPVLAFCEGCGSTTEFPGLQRDTIQDCPQCGATIDVSDEETAVTGERPHAGSARRGLFDGLKSLKKAIILFFVGCIGIYFCLLLLSDLSSAWGG